MCAAVSDRGLGEARELAYDRSYARRQALGRILRPRAFAIQDATLGHAYRATNFLGLGAMGAKRWAAISSRGLPKFLDALEAGDAERIRLLDEAGTFITDLRAAGGAPAEGFDPEELEDELRVYQRAFEARIIYRT